MQTSAITDAEMIEWFNDGQKLIQNLIFKSNPKADIFKGEKLYSATADGIYELPSDIYSVNAISAVEVSSGHSTSDFVNLDRVDERNKNEVFGYYIQDKKLILTGCSTYYPFSSLRVTYFKALPRFDKRWAKITSIAPGASITVDSGFDSLASTVDDKICIIDSNGVIVKENVGITDFASNVWSTTADLTGVTAGMYVCMGHHSTNISGLSEECEPYLLDYVRKRLYGRNVYTADMGAQEIFTAEQKDELVRLFMNNTKEIQTPPITDFTHLEW